MSATRTPVNPWSWSLDYGFNQAELVEGASRVLVLSGQGSAAADGTLLHAGDFAAQVSLSLDNIETVLKEAGMTLATSSASTSSPPTSTP
jgi:enamine deaminase RidA (YjgF/YER057c/UK114 family)